MKLVIKKIHILNLFYLSDSWKYQSHLCKPGYCLIQTCVKWTPWQNEKSFKQEVTKRDKKTRWFNKIINIWLSSRSGVQNWLCMFLQTEPLHFITKHCDDITFTHMLKTPKLVNHKICINLECIIYTKQKKMFKF